MDCNSIVVAWKVFCLFAISDNFFSSQEQWSTCGKDMHEVDVWALPGTVWNFLRIHALFLLYCRNLPAVSYETLLLSF